MTVTKMCIFFERHDRFGSFLQGILADDRAICVQKDIAIEPFFAEWNLRSMRFQKNLRFPKAFTKWNFLNEVYHYISRFSQETCEIHWPLRSVNFFWNNGKLLTQWRETCDFYLYFFCQSGLIESLKKKTSAQWRLQKCEYILNDMTVLGAFCREYSHMIGEYVCKRILQLNHFSLNEIFAVCVSRKIFGFQRLLQNETFWTKFTIIFHDFLRKHAKYKDLHGLWIFFWYNGKLLTQ